MFKFIKNTKRQLEISAELVVILTLHGVLSDEYKVAAHTAMVELYKIRSKKMQRGLNLYKKLGQYMITAAPYISAVGEGCAIVEELGKMYFEGISYPEFEERKTAMVEELVEKLA